MSGAALALAQVGAVVASVALMWKGADWAVDSAARIARRLNVSELVIGLTLVAAGTSAPEFAVSIGAALTGKADISVGNIIGSNIFNLGFILGGCAAIRPILSSRPLVYRDGVFLVVVTVALALLIGDLQLSRWEGGLMMAALLIYVLVLWRWRAAGRGDGEPREGGEGGSEASSTPRDLGIATFSLAMVVGGSHLLVWGASGLASAMGLSQWSIAVTIVAAGTSAPEMVTSLTAVLKGRHGISAGGLIGSDIYNLLGVLGLAAVMRPLAVAPAGRDSIYLLVAMVVLALLFLRSGWRVSRGEGIILVAVAAVRWWADMTETTLIDLLR